MITERVDDIPLLIAEFEKSQLCEYFNQHFPDHGNWTGLDGGKVTVGFLTYILSCADHRLSCVEAWSAEHLYTLRHCLGDPDLTSKDFTDDRLGALLDKYSDEEQWDAFESAHNQGLIRVYTLDTISEPIRLDAMIAQSFRSPDEEFKLGYAKQHRADLPQLKVMLATIDPLSMPLVSLIAPGNKTDDVLYVPVIKKVISNLGNSGQLFVGDAKLGSLSNRAYIQQQDQYYLCPLGKKQCSPAQLQEYLADKPEELSQVFNDPTSQDQVRAQAFELSEELYCEEYDLHWTERRIVVHSTSWAEQQRKSLDQRLDKAEEILGALLERKQGKKVLSSKAEIEAKAAQVIEKQKLKGLIDVRVEEHVELIPVQKYGDRPAGFKEQRHFSLHIHSCEEKLAQYRENLGWRVYACNAPLERLSTTQAVICYRQEYRIEHKFNELLNKITVLMPVFLKKPNRVKALIRLLLLALKFVSLIQHQARKELEATGQYIKELYPGNPGRKTTRPTTKMILEAFQNITLVVVPMENQTFIKISDLKPVQLQILKLLKIPPEIYLSLENIPFSQFDLGET